MKARRNTRPSAHPATDTEHKRSSAVEVRRYRRPDGWLTRHWAIYVNSDLLAVVLYRKGAEAIAAALVKK